MPNHCESDLTVEGPTALVAELREYVRHTTVDDGEAAHTSAFSLTAIIPYPEKYLIQDAQAKAYREEFGRSAGGPSDGFNDGGYDWRCANWDTKWDCYRLRDEEDYRYADNTSWSISFDTAWAPPLPVIRALGEKFPGLEVTIRYFESGMQYNGILRIRGGEVVKEDQATYYGTRGG